MSLLRLLSKAVCKSFRTEHRPVQGSGPRKLRLVRQAHTGSSEVAVKVAIYVAGFPCKAFSALRYMSDWMEDAEAQPFYGCISNMKRCRPVAASLHESHNICKIITLFHIVLCSLDVRLEFSRTFSGSKNAWTR